MKNYFVLAVCFALGCVRVYCDPLTLIQPGNVLPVGTSEIGFSDTEYRNNAVNDPVQTFTTETTVFPLIFRMGVGLKLEFALGVSMGAYYNSTYNNSLQLVDEALYSGMSGQSYSDFFLKYSRDENSAYSIRIDIPSSASVFSQGYNLMPVYERKINPGEYFISCVNLGYNYTGQYISDIDNDAQNEIVDEQDILFAGISLEHPASGKVSFLGEFIFQWFATDLVVDGARQGVAGGTRMEAVVGARGRFGAFKTKLGVSVSLGQEKYREYDYRVLLGISYVTDFLAPLIG